ncbi:MULTISPECIES: ArpA protein [Pseudomonas]|uniref:ArpA protein n=1 Tax=Pseudomonas quercus TaxID=2722792 RepID=A0ABX0YET0_9PSED|nr:MULTISPECIES: ArpA protein [Pseudomonas]MBF7143067.1 ArpA protein [Pseudomonas sp. LY10J]NJP01904.1 ArpA protein [Pseudomonas quercus]
MCNPELKNEVKRVVATNPFTERDMFWERHQFARYGYLRVTHMISPVIVKVISSEVKWLLENFGKRRDFLIESTEYTPRYLTNVPRDLIKKNGELIPTIYNSLYLKGLIEAITGDAVISTPWKWDNYIINSQHFKGDTHGWHWGDYPYTIIWVVKAPEISAGGLLECVPHTHWNKKNPRVQELLINNPINTYSHIDGDVYLLKADTTLHRVNPLQKDCERLILNTTWEREKDKTREVEHETFIFRD